MRIFIFLTVFILMSLAAGVVTFSYLLDSKPNIVNLKPVQIGTVPLKNENNSNQSPTNLPVKTLIKSQDIKPKVVKNRTFKIIYTEQELNNILQNKLEQLALPELKQAINSIFINLDNNKIYIIAEVNTKYLPSNLSNLFIFKERVNFTVELGINIINNIPQIIIYNFYIGKISIPLDILKTIVDINLINQIIQDTLFSNIKVSNVIIKDKTLTLECIK